MDYSHCKEPCSVEKLAYVAVTLGINPSHFRGKYCVEFLHTKHLKNFSNMFYYKLNYLQAHLAS